MRIKMTFRLCKKTLISDYHPCIISFFKAALSKYDNKLYDSLYGSGAPIQKNFTFSTYLPNSTFSNDEIILDDKTIVVTLSTPDMIFGIDFYNAALGMKNMSYPFGNNIAKLIQIKVENHKVIKSETVYFKMLSPVIVKAHIKGSRDEYYTVGDECFYGQLKLICTKQFEKLAPYLCIKNLEIEAVNCKKTVVALFGQKITATLGIFKLKAETEIINYLYQAGIGSKRSSGFGFFEIIREEDSDEY
ncbi:MAG: CRISPR-associated endoribonuclease Cas6 [Eubacteriales bacterium]